MGRPQEFLLKGGVWCGLGGTPPLSPARPDLWTRGWSSICPSLGFSQFDPEIPKPQFAWEGWSLYSGLSRPPDQLKMRLVEPRQNTAREAFAITLASGDT